MAVADQLRVDTRQEGNRVIVRLEGELDMATAPLLRAAIEDADALGKAMLVLDLQQLSFIDSTGLRMILWGHERCQQRGAEFAVTPGSQQVQRLLEISGAGEHLRVIATAGELV